jgi:hypothetical protein
MSRAAAENEDLAPRAVSCRMKNKIGDHLLC